MTGFKGYRCFFNDKWSAKGQTKPSYEVNKMYFYENFLDMKRRCSVMFYANARQVKTLKGMGCHRFNMGRSIWQGKLKGSCDEIAFPRPKENEKGSKNDRTKRKKKNKPTHTSL